MRPSPPALVAFAAWILLALGSRGLPLVRFPIFQFPRSEGPSVSFAFFAAGEPAAIEDYEGFHGFGPEAVDLRHEGYACGVQHKLHEAADWIGRHPGEGPGPVPVSLGLRIFSPTAEGVHSTVRVDARGTAHPR